VFQELGAMHLRFRLLALASLVALLVAAPPSARAGKVVLKSGFEIPGLPVNVPGLTKQNAAANLGQNVPQTPYYMVDDGIRRYFVHRQNLQPGAAGVDASDDSSKYPRFKLEPLKKRQDAVPTWIGRYIETTPWDAHGRCTVTLATPQGPDPVQLAITRLDPRYLTVASTSHEWDFGMHLSLIPAERLREIIHSAIDPRDPDQRMAVVQFFLFAEGQIGSAQAELEGIRQDFPELAARVEELKQAILEQYGRRAIAEILHRRTVGQHRLARFLAQRTLQENLQGDTLREAQLVLDEYATAEQQMEQARGLLGSLQSELSPEDAARVSAVRSTVELELNFDTLPRLSPFLTNAADPALTAAEKLALAYSAWIVGESYADTSLSTALALWDARFLVLEHLHPDTDFGGRRLIEERLAKFEGVSVPVVARMVPQLPTPLEFPAAGPQTIELAPPPEGGEAVRYCVQAPPEYNPGRKYPAVVVLRHEGRSIEQTVDMWAGNAERPGIAQRRGYVVIAPDYAPAGVGEYDYGRAAHDAVLRALFDARQRLNIDSDRVFLSGSGMGGDAAFDLGLAYPDLWAGVVPFTGFFQHAARLIEYNAPHLPFYVVGGERDRSTLETNAGGFSHRMEKGWDFIYCEYKQRGNEAYLEELPRIFEWMEIHRRPHVVKDFKHTFVRDFDNRVGWLKSIGLPPAASLPITWGKDKPGRRSFTIEARIPTESTVYVGRQPAKRCIVWLSPEMIDYEQAAKVTVSPKPAFHGFLEPQLSTLLGELRDRGDRQMLYWTRLEF
jgi:acetyl esterase/lipase